MGEAGRSGEPGGVPHFGSETVLSWGPTHESEGDAICDRDAEGESKRRGFATSGGATSWSWGRVRRKGEGGLGPMQQRRVRGSVGAGISFFFFFFFTSAAEPLQQ